MASVLLRDAAVDDVAILTALVRAAYERYVPRIGGLPRPMTEDYAEVIRSREVKVAVRGEVIAGLIVLDVCEHAVVIENVAVHPAQQQMGVGRALLEHAEAVARRGGLPRICLYTHERMTENLALYSRVGYVEYDRRRHGAANIVYLRKELAPSVSQDG